MDYSTVPHYFITLVALTAAPGPLMAVLVVRTLARDTKGAAAFAVGVCAGDALATLAVALGIGVWAQSRPELFSLGKYLGVAYLLWLAVGIWSGRSGLASNGQQKSGWVASSCAGMALCLGNPSTLLIYMLLLPIIAPSGYVGIEQMTQVVFVTILAVGTVLFGTILLASQLKGMIDTPASSRMFGRVTAATIALTSVWMLAA